LSVARRRLSGATTVVMPQITTYLPAPEHFAVVAYAGEFGLDVGALANLLFHRELRVGRLPRLAAADDGGRGVADVKITAHQSDGALKARWRAHAKTAGLSMSRAGALLFRAELSERWLQRAVNQFDSK
jgi:hypothetical protein